MPEGISSEVNRADKKQQKNVLTKTTASLAKRLKIDKCSAAAEHLAGGALSAVKAGQPVHYTQPGISFIEAELCFAVETSVRNTEMRCLEQRGLKFK
jgi:hypothetical protein